MAVKDATAFPAPRTRRRPLTAVSPYSPGPH